MNKKEVCKKARFATEKYTLEHIDKLRRTSTRELPEILRPYLCNKCNSWHLTSTSERTEKTIQSIENKLAYRKIQYKIKAKSCIKLERENLRLKESLNKYITEKSNLRTTQDNLSLQGLFTGLIAVTIVLIILIL